VGKDDESLSNVRRLLIERIIPQAGLNPLRKELERTTGISLDFLNRADWAQISVAFEVRNLVEHRDGMVDQAFLRNISDYWGNSSWRRFATPLLRDRVPVEEEDVTGTYEAMMQSTRRLSKELLSWAGPSGLASSE
jgi:hypothetical protein